MVVLFASSALSLCNYGRSHLKMLLPQLGLTLQPSQSQGTMAVVEMAFHISEWQAVLMQCLAIFLNSHANDWSLKLKRIAGTLICKAGTHIPVDLYREVSTVGSNLNALYKATISYTLDLTYCFIKSLLPTFHNANSPAFFAWLAKIKVASSALWWTQRARYILNNKEIRQVLRSFLFNYMCNPK